MYCKNCGNEIANGAKFCSHCGNPVEASPQSSIPEEQPKQDMNGGIYTQPSVSPDTVQQSTGAFEPEEKPRKPIFEEFNWNVSDYPDRESAGKTEEIDFNWDANPADIPDVPASLTGLGIDVSPIDLHTGAEAGGETLKGADLENAVFGQAKPEQSSESLSAASKIDKFYTFNKKNEDFQKLLNKEYHNVKSGNAIEHEMSQAEQLAQQRFESRHADPSMEAFLEREGIVKPYQPKEFESDILQKIEAQEAEREAKRLEEEARLAAIEQARLAAMEQTRLEAEAKKKIEEEAAKLEIIAQKKAQEEARVAEEARLRAREEAKLRAQEESRLRAEEEARLKAEAQVKLRETEEARLKAEADLRAAQEAAKIRAQQEARLAAEAEAQFKAAQKRKQMADIEAQRRLDEAKTRISSEANQAVAQEEVRKVLEQTARMRKEEADKIKAAVAGIRAGSSVESEPLVVKSDVADAHQATKNQINEMAKAREAFFAEMEPQAAQEPIVDPLAENRPVTGRDTLLSDIELGRTRVVDKNEILEGLKDATRVVSKESIASAVNEAQPLDFKPEENSNGDIDDLLSQFESVTSIEDKPESLEFAGDPLLAEEAMIENTETVEKPGLNDTIVMPHSSKLEDAPVNDFDSYGNEEAANYLNQQAQQMPEKPESNAMDDFYGNDFYDDEDESQMSKKELKQRAKENKRLEKEKAKGAKSRSKKNGGDAGIDAFEDKDPDEKGSKGRLALKIILIVLIVVLAVEVIGMGIKFIAPQSKAAEFIDTQLNKVIQLVTGEDTQYSVIAAQVRNEPIEDKTDLINAQKNKNKNNNIKSIVYSADLSYDQERDGKVSDLVLSQPMTQVEWGKDKDNYPVYYDEQVVGEIIAFESKRVNLMNKGNENVLAMIDEGSKLYQQTVALKDKKMDGTFDKLEIGEIRQAGSNYYIWVRETIGSNTTELVYSMYPEKKFVMKMLACYEV